MDIDKLCNLHSIPNVSFGMVLASIQENHLGWEELMNEEQFKGKWNEIKGGFRNLWGRITDDEVEQTKGNLASLSGIVQERYGETKDSFDKKLDQLMSSFENDTDKNITPDESSYERNPTRVKSGTDYDSDEIYEDRNARH